MRKKITPPAPDDNSSKEIALRGEIDTTYLTQQKDMFTSGLAASIGTCAYSVWHAIKSHASFETGKSWPGIRRSDLPGMAIERG